MRLLGGGFFIPVPGFLAGNEKFFIILRFIESGKMSTGNIIRFSCILLLWLALCYLLVTRSARIDFNVVFAIVASGIIVFVPLYKKYVRKKD